MLAVLLMARSSLADHYTVPSSSMTPTVAVGDRVLVNKLAYGVRVPWTEIWLGGVDAPEVGDVIVLTSPEDGKVLLKRVVRVDDDVLFVMGDNRNNSHDSRAFGSVDKEAVLGRAFAVVMRDGGLTWLPL